MDDLLTIGRFARLSGLSIGALRHYDELDLLRPARVDPVTGYRSYRREQIETARAISRLRDLELPLDEIRLLLAADDPVARRSRLEAHRARLEARSFRLGRVLHVIHHLIAQGDLTMSESSVSSVAPTATSAPGAASAAPPATTELDPATRRRLAVDLFNHVWSLLETADRSADQDDEMLHAAHASRYHWGEVGEPANRARGEWQCSRVYAVLGRGEPALWHARRCLVICEANGIADWDVAAAYEALARASLVAGDAAAARSWRDLGREACAVIADPEDRRLIESDIDSLSTLGLD